LYPEKGCGFDTASKTFGAIKRFHGNYEGASKSMETFILGRLVHRWIAKLEHYRVCPQSGRIFYGGLDRKGMTLFDKNHVIISWRRLYQELQ
jgi:hypothetical protein